MRATPRVAGVPGRDASATPGRRDATRLGSREDADRAAVSMDAATSGLTTSSATFFSELGDERAFTCLCQSSGSPGPDEGARFHGVVVNHGVVFHRIDPRHVLRDPPRAHHSTRGERLVLVSDALRRMSPWCATGSRCAFKDWATGVDVTLVGTMHYNPVSIELASSTVTRLREADALHAVVLESCPSRWKKTQKTQPPGSFLRWFLYNEMLAAADAAGDPTKIRLGDQRIEDLGACAKRTMADTARDVLDPLGGGWGRLVRDWRDGFKKEIDGRGDLRGTIRCAADLWPTSPCS